MEQECILVVASQVMPIGIEVRGELLRADASVSKRVANSGPGFRFGRRHEPPSSGSRRAVRHAFESVYSVPLESADLPRICFHYGSLIRSDDFAASARGCR